jgi:hypothetical protein
MKTREEMEIQIGKHVMSAFDSFYKEKNMSPKLTVPILLPLDSSMPNVPTMNCTFEMPYFVVRNKDGNLDVITMAEAYGWNR